MGTIPPTLEEGGGSQKRTGPAAAVRFLSLYSIWLDISLHCRGVEVNVPEAHNCLSHLINLLNRIKTSGREEWQVACVLLVDQMRLGGPDLSKFCL